MLEIIVSALYLLDLDRPDDEHKAEFRQIRPQTPALAEEKPTLAMAA